MNPQRVIVGGGVAKSGKKYWQSLREAVLNHVLPGMEMDVVPAALKDDSPLWGAIALAKGLI
jgi:glucokinase